MKYSHYQWVEGTVSYHSMLMWLLGDGKKSSKYIYDTQTFEGGATDDYIYVRDLEGEEGIFYGGDGSDTIVFRGDQEDYVFTAEGDGVRVTRLLDPNYSLLLYDFESAVFVPEGNLKVSVVKSALPVLLSTLVIVDDAASDPVNLAPIANDDSGYELVVGDTIEVLVSDLLGNDSDPEIDALAITGIGDFVGGEAVLNGDRILFTASAAGPASFSYTLSDGQLTDTATVSLTVDALPNTAPLAADDSGFALVEGETLEISVAELLANDSDPENDSLSITGVSDFVGGEAVMTGDRILFTATAAGAASFTYTLSDGQLTDTATVSLTAEEYIPPNNPPVANDDSGFTVVAGETIRIPLSDLLVNDSDPDGEPLSISGVDDPVNGTVEIIGDEIHFTATAEGSASFTYTLSDGRAIDLATVSLTVEAPAVDPNPTGEYDIPQEALVTPTASFGLVNPSIGGGLEKNRYFAESVPFIDLFKQASHWTVVLKDGSTVTYSELEAGGYLDENGWLMTMPEDASYVRSLVYSPPEFKEAYSYLSGRYVMTYEGDAEIEVPGNIVSQEPGRIVFDYDGGNLHVLVRSMDPNETNDYLRNITIVREDLVDLHEAGAIFNPDFIEVIEDHRVLRFMDWQLTNDSPQAEFNDMPTEDYYTWGLLNTRADSNTGVPLSVMVELANQVGADPWFNIPHQATDDYIRQYAEFVRDHLDPNLTAYFEYSNEVWNGTFDQHQWAHDMGLEVFANVPEFQDDTFPGMEYYGYRSAEMMSIIKDVFGSEFDSRIHGVLSTQTANPGRLPSILNGAEYSAALAGQTVDDLYDSVGVTGYFDGGLSRVETEPMMRQWIEESKSRFEAGLEPDPYQYFIEQAVINIRDQSLQQQAFDEGLITSPDKGHSLADIADFFAQNMAIAQSYGLGLVQYEGGSHTVVPKQFQDDAELMDYYWKLNYSPEMAQLTSEMIQLFRDAGGTLVNDFAVIWEHSDDGFFGSLEHLGDTSPIFDVWADYNQSTPGDWEERSADAFLHGGVFEGTTGDDVLLGTIKQDFLLGDAGNDILRGGAGDDGYNGGDGNDVVVLEGSASEYFIQAQDGGYVVEGPDGDDYVINVEQLYFTVDGMFFDLG